MRATKSLRVLALNIMVLVSTLIATKTDEQIVDEATILATRRMGTQFEVEPNTENELPIVTQIEELPEFELSEEELDFLNRTVMAEAGNQGEQGIALVCSVILNRVKNEDFPNNVIEVVSQDGQFAVYPKRIWKVTPTDEVKETVKAELRRRSNKEVLYFRTGHYHKGREELFKVGEHYFSK